MAVWKSLLVFFLLGSLGLGTWLFISALGGETEARDSPLYLCGLPVMIVLPFAAGYLFPGRFKLWGFAVFVFQPVILFGEGAIGRSLLPGLLLLALLAGICTLASYGGYLLRQKHEARSDRPEGSS